LELRELLPEAAGVYSARRATIGSTRAARRAGSLQASKVAIPKSTATLA